MTTERKRKKQNIRRWPLILPFMVSLIAAVFDSWVMCAVFCLVVYLTIPLLPEFRHRENLAAAYIVAVCGLPINVRIAFLCSGWINAYGETPLLTLLYAILIMCFLVSAEESLFGVIARIIWRKQYKLRL